MRRSSAWRGVATAVALLAMMAAGTARADQAATDARQAAPEIPAAGSIKPLVSAQRHMVAAANPYAAEAGRQILREGGSAVDAAIATQLVLNLVEPQSSGIGGGAFLVLYDAKTKRVTSVDGRETAPAAATPQRFLDRDGKPLEFDAAVNSGLSTGVPGVVAALALAHKNSRQAALEAAVRARHQAGDRRLQGIAAPRQAARRSGACRFRPGGPGAVLSR